MAEVYTSNDVLLSVKAISVEEFMPDRIKVNVNLNKPVLKLDEKIEVTATALNLFGPPAANRNYEMTFDLKRKHLSPKAYPGYNFFVVSNKNNANPGSRQLRNNSGSNELTFQKEVRQGKTDAEGLAKESLLYQRNTKI
jgi:uncharacterized protein YfaS (alpha-2-macroglobulin family)